jgi:hypothetical protein
VRKSGDGRLPNTFRIIGGDYQAVAAPRTELDEQLNRWPPEAQKYRPEAS